jgi:hypothetical protein
MYIDYEIEELENKIKVLTGILEDLKEEKKAKEELREYLVAQMAIRGDAFIGRPASRVRLNCKEREQNK